MAAEHNQQVVRDLYDCFNSKDFDRLESLCTEDCRITQVSFGPTMGARPVRKSMEAWTSAFPDGKLEIQNIVAQGDTVIAEIIGRGTHRGDLEGPEGGVPATHLPVTMKMVDVYDMKGGRIAAIRSYFDTQSLNRQIQPRMVQMPTSPQQIEETHPVI